MTKQKTAQAAFPSGGTGTCHWTAARLHPAGRLPAGNGVRA
jgi:hypothetical protein